MVTVALSTMARICIGKLIVSKAYFLLGLPKTSTVRDFRKRWLLISSFHTITSASLRIFWDFLQDRDFTTKENTGIGNTTPFFSSKKETE